MKRYISTLLACAMLLSMVIGLTVTAPKPAQAAEGLKIGLVTDVGQVDDRSFNQSAWEGTQEAAKELGGTADYIETKDMNDYATNIGLFADQGYDVIVTVGFLLGDATIAAAKKYPKIYFIGIDQAQPEVVPNLTGLIFQEAKSGFLAGVLAGRLTKSGVVAAVLGQEVPAVVGFKSGYEAGARYARPDIKVLSTYHPSANDAFTDPAWGAQTAGQAMDQSADVVFGAGGKTGNGALEEVAKRTTKENPLYCIGVDTDQWFTVPAAQPCLVSSAMKLISEGVITLFKQYADKTIKPGNFIGKVALAPFHDFDKVVPPEVAKELTDIKAQLDADTLDPLTGKPPVAATAEPTESK
jgi:basic membrane protein A